MEDSAAPKFALPDNIVADGIADKALLFMAPLLLIFFDELTTRNPSKALRHMLKFVDFGITQLEKHLSGPLNIWNMADVDVGRPFVDGFLSTALNVNINELTDEQRQAVNMYSRFIGFALTVPIGISSAAIILKGTFGNRFDGGVLAAIAKLPEELGVSWALGMMMDRLVEIAAGPAVDEVVLTKLQNARLEWPILRQLVRQRVLPQDKFEHLLKLQGFNEERRALISQLDTAQLTPSELQSAFIYGYLSEEHCKAYLGRLGYSDKDVAILLNIYIQSAMTPAQNAYFSALRSALAEQRVTESQFRQLASHMHIPASEIEVTIQMIQFEHSVGRINESITTIKRLLLGHELEQSQALAELAKLGYTAKDAGDLVQSWYILNASPPKPLSNAKVQQYQKSGVIGRDDAYKMYIKGGMDAKSAAFIADHPNATSGSPSPAMSVSSIQYAYLDKVIDAPTAEKALTELTGEAEFAKREVDIWEYQRTHEYFIKPAQKQLERDQIERAFKAGVMSDAATITALESDQFSVGDAQILWATWYAELHGHKAGDPPPPINLP